MTEAVADGNMKENIRKYCRLCANTIKKDLVPIFDTRGQCSEKISDRINACLPVSVFEDDGLPQQICMSCKKKLNISYDLSQCSVLAEEKLRQINFKSQFDEDPFAKQNLRLDDEEESMPPSNLASTSADSVNIENSFRNRVTKQAPPNWPPAVSPVVSTNQSVPKIVEKSSVTAVIVAEKFKKINPKLRVVLVPKDGSNVPISQRVTSALKAYKQKFQGKKMNLVQPDTIVEAGATDDSILDCASCQLTFGFKKDRKQHYIDNHPKQIFDCPKCHETVFGSQEIINKHEEMHKLTQATESNPVSNRSASNMQDCEDNNPAIMVINLGEYNPNLTKKKAAVQRFKILTKATDHSGIKTDIKQQVLAALCKFLSNDQPHAISQQLGRETPTSETHCRICLRKCTRMATLQKHLIQSHKPKVDAPKCEHCEKILPLYGTEEHVKKKHSTGNYLVCRVCDTEYSKTGIEQPHMYLAPRNPCVESTCNEHFSTQEALADHAYHIHQICNYNCDFCGKGFKNSISIANHILSKHLCTEPAVCKVCGKSFTTATGLNIHKKNMHTHQEQCVCDICGKVVPKYALKSHIHNHFYYSQVRKCESCHKMLKIKAWHRHRKFHAKHGPDSVVRRGKKAKKTDIAISDDKSRPPIASKKQMKTIDPKEKVECQMCHHMYLRRSLKTHMKHHYNLKDFECALCDKKYVSRNTLTSHIQEIHLKVGHHCQYCNKFFYRKGSVLAHEALHRGERNFKCPVCPKTFPGKRNVYSHMWQVHNNGNKKKQLSKKVPNISNSIVQIHAEELGHKHIVSIQGNEYMIPDVIVNIDTKTCEVTFNKQASK